ncbi:hypothetical protein FJZ19_03830 [Candidatus Pacearchaeota archaeon]|nr:hypothetical protein [Candidatus Pacearchaeota archaeon]
MTLRLGLRELEDALKEAGRDSNNAYRLNMIVREIDEDILFELPDNEYVKEKVIPLFVRVINTIRTSSATGQYSQYMGYFVHIINWRIDRLRKGYLKKAA